MTSRILLDAALASGLTATTVDTISSTDNTTKLLLALISAVTTIVYRYLSDKTKPKATKARSARKKLNPEGSPPNGAAAKATVVEGD